MSEPHSIAFYAVDSDRPLIQAYHRAGAAGWSALSSALASHFDADAESFNAAEAYWNEDRESAELVSWEGRIIGAVNRPISSADIASIKKDHSMEKRAFANRIRALFNVDGYLLPELTKSQQVEFVRDPVRYFLRADDAQSDAIFRELESRQTATPASASIVQPVALEAKTIKKAPKRKKAGVMVEGQREMLLPIPGGKPSKDMLATGKPAHTVMPRSKAG